MFCFIICLGVASLRPSAAHPRPASTTKVTTCDTAGNVHRLSCDDGVIVVQAALYGRLDRQTCSEGWTNNLDNIHCSQDGARDVLKKRCDGKSSCEVAADAFHSSDPCYGTYKYLESTYACVGRRHHTSLGRSVACEGSIAHVRCDQGQVIHVHWAEYGRHDASTCSQGRPASQLQNVQCVATVTGQVSRMCNLHSSCFIPVSNSMFGDPCGGTYKYLKVAYSCYYAALN